MTHSPKRKIWAGALCALVALVAAVVVARPAAAAPAEAQTTAAGYKITQTSNESANVDALVNTTPTAVVITPSTSIEDLTITGSGTTPIQVNIGTADETPVITLSDLTVSTGAAAPITVDKGGGKEDTNNVVVVVEGAVSLTSTTGQPAIAASMSGLAGFYITGSGTLTASSNGTNAVLTSGALASLPVGIGVPTTLAGNDTTVPASLADVENAVTVSLSETESSGAAISGTAIALTVEEGCTLNAEVSDEASTAVDLGTGDLVVNGAMTVNDGGSTTGETVGLACGTITVDGVDVEDASLSVTSSGNAINAGGKVSVASGTLVAESQAVPNDDVEPAIAGAPAINCVAAGIEVTGGSLTATSAGTDGIYSSDAAAIAVSGDGVLTATGATAGVATAKGSITVKGAADGDNNVAGPTVTISTTSTEDDAAAVNLGTDTGQTKVQVISNVSGSENYLWVAQSGTGTTATPAAGTEIPMLVRGYAGMTGDKATDGITFDGSTNTLPGAKIVIQPNPIKSFNMSVTPVASSSGTSAGGVVDVNQADGFMVANTGATSGLSSSSCFVYTPTLSPAFETPMELDTQNTALGVAVSGANLSKLTVGGKTIPAYNGSGASESPVVIVGTNVGIAVTNAANQQTYSIVPKSSSNKVTSLVSAGDTLLDELYGTGKSAPVVGSDSEPVPVSYQVIFNPNNNAAPASNIAPTPMPANADPASAFGYTDKTNKYGVYFTKPGEGTPMNGTDPSLSTATPVTELPAASLTSNVMLGWYLAGGTAKAPTYGPDPTTTVGTYSQNTTYVAFYGGLTSTAQALGGTPMTLEAGATKSFTIPVTVAVNKTMAIPGGESKALSINVSPSAIDTSDVVDSVAIATQTAGGQTSGGANGVTYGTPTVTGTAPNLTVSVPVSASATATQGAYRVTVDLKNVNIPGNSDATLDGVLNVEGVAPATGTTVMRLYNRATGEHLLTTQQAEITALTSTGVWVEEGEAWIAPSEGQPVYRLYNPNSQDHYFTTSKAEAQYLQGLGWSWDNSQQPVFYGSVDSGYPVYQIFNPNATRGTHLWTVDKHEYDVLSTTGGWQGENAKWFALDIPAPDAN